MKTGFQDLSLMLGHLVLAPAQAQRIFDQDWAESQGRWLEQIASVLAGIPEEDRAEMAAVLVSSAPSRQIVSTCQMDASVRIEIGREQRFGIGVKALDLGWERVLGSHRSSAFRIVLSVETAGFPGGEKVKI